MATEWLFEFVVDGGRQERDPKTFSEELHDEIVDWAEAKGLGIGGAFELSSLKLDNSSRFRFGLVATNADQQISEASANSLVQFICARTAEAGCKFFGGFRRFSRSEIDPLPESLAHEE